MGAASAFSGPRLAACHECIRHGELQKRRQDALPARRGPWQKAQLRISADGWRSSASSVDFGGLVFIVGVWVGRLSTCGLV